MSEEHKEFITRRIRKDFNSMSIDSCDFCYQLESICSEMEQLETTMTCLKGLIDWCEIFLNNDVEEKDCARLKQAYGLLDMVHDSYKTNY